MDSPLVLHSFCGGGGQYRHVAMRSAILSLNEEHMNFGVYMQEPGPSRLLLGFHYLHKKVHKSTSLCSLCQ